MLEKNVVDFNIKLFAWNDDKEGLKSCDYQEELPWGAEKGFYLKAKKNEDIVNIVRYIIKQNSEI